MLLQISLNIFSFFSQNNRAYSTINIQTIYDIFIFFIRLLQIFKCFIFASYGEKRSFLNQSFRLQFFNFSSRALHQCHEQSFVQNNHLACKKREISTFQYKNLSFPLIIYYLTKMKINRFIFVLIFSIICFYSLGQAQLAKGQTKFLGNIMPNFIPSDFATYWNQVTLQWLGKWAHVQPNQGTWNWDFIDASYNYAKTNGFPYKQHTFIWSIQDPSWINGLSSAQRIQAIQNWIQTFCQRYPNVDFIDVLNQPLHTRPVYADDLGGNGTTGWDWVIKSFEYARQYCPNSKLFINDYNIEAFQTSTTKYLQIINLLKQRNLIDGIGIQCHQLQGAGTIPILKNLHRLAETGLPIHVSELDLFSADDNEQLIMYKRIFPLLYEHPAVKGVTLWGYDTNNLGSTAGLKNGTVERAALTWLRTQYFNSSVNKAPRAFWTSTSSGLKVSFSGQKSWDFDGSLASYSWNFGDGSTATGSTGSHTYTAAGSYQVSLTVTDNQGSTNTFTDTLVLSSTSLDTSVDWTKPIAYCRQKFIGCTILHDYLSPNWGRYWNQVTPQYLGKWTSTEPNKDQMSWSGHDFAWNYAKQNGLLFKGHTFIWGQQIPYWVGGLSSAEQAQQVEEWIRLYCERYPDYQLIDVVNEPLHEIPNYANAIGGSGSTGWDWVVWGYEKARKHCPNAKLLINDYFILSDAANTQKYIEIINILKSKNLIDGIGCQSHQLQYTANSVITQNLNSLQTTGLPVYISQLDINYGDDTQQLNRFKSLVPLLYQHPAVKGVTFWGYIKGEHWLSGAWMYDPNGSGASQSSCTVQNLSTNIQLTLNTWQNYTVQLPSSGKIRVLFANDGAANSQTMAVDYAIIDGVKYEAENQPINTAVWNGLTCGGSYSQMMHCPGYIEFPSGSQSVTICAMAAQGGAQKMTIQLVTACTPTSSSTVGLPQQRASLKWLKYEYLPTIKSSTKPTASYKYTLNGMTLSLDGKMSTDCDGNIVMYSWSFGDGGSASGDMGTHTYSTAGSYVVQLTVFDNDGNGDIMTKTITVGTPANQAPTASFTPTVNGMTVNVDGTGSKDVDGSISSYSWNWGDSTSDSTGVSGSHTYSASGTYTITLTVTDNLGAKSTTTKSVTISAVVANIPPVSKFTATVNELTVNFVSISTDADGSIASYAWNMGNGVTNNNQQVTYTYPSAGTYTVTLTVTDNAGATSSSSQVVTVQQSTVIINQPPVCSIGNVNVNFLQVNAASSSTDDSNSIVNYLWEWGDSQSSSGSTLQNTQHTYTNAGPYTIKLTVVDNGGLSSSCTRSIVTTTQTVVQNNPPVSSFGYWSNGKTINFWFSGWDSDGQVTGFEWNFGDGQTSTSNAPSHTYATVGTYTVTLTVTDNLGATGTSQQSIQVTSPSVNFHLQSVQKSIIKVRNLSYGRAEVKILDNNGDPVGNVFVSGQISNPSLNLWETVSGTTNSSGLLTLQTTNGLRNLPDINVCVWSFNHPTLWYNQNENKSPNCI